MAAGCHLIVKRMFENVPHARVSVRRPFFLESRPVEHLVSPPQSLCQSEQDRFTLAHPQFIWTFERQLPISPQLTLVSHALKNYDSRSTRGRMSQTPLTRELRRSTRVPLKVVIKAQSLTEPLTCDGETIVVNRHGALISSGVPLRVGMEIEIHVIMTDKRAPAKVVYVDPERPRVCGIGLAEPENIWGVSFPPDDWYEAGPES
jgi:hypothetical protein